MTNVKETKDSRQTAPRIDWDDSKMDTVYANVANAASTREEVALLFGTNTSWLASGDKPVKIDLTNRIILSPFAAKRFSILLSSVLEEYEMRFGKLDVTPPQAKGRESKVDV